MGKVKDLITDEDMTGLMEIIAIYLLKRYWTVSFDSTLTAKCSKEKIVIHRLDTRLYSETYFITYEDRISSKEESFKTMSDFVRIVTHWGVNK